MFVASALTIVEFRFISRLLFWFILLLLLVSLQTGKAETKPVERKVTRPPFSPDIPHDGLDKMDEISAAHALQKSASAGVPSLA